MTEVPVKFDGDALRVIEDNVQCSQIKQWQPFIESHAVIAAMTEGSCIRDVAEATSSAEHLSAIRDILRRINLHGVILRNSWNDETRSSKQ